MASFRGDEAWTARRRAGAGYARRHAPECDAPRLEVARSVHLSTWPPCIVPPCAARSEIEVAATETVLNAGAEILVRKGRTSFLKNPARKDTQKRSESVEFPVRDSSLFFFFTDVVAGKRASLSLTVFAPNSRSAREGQTYRLRVERGYVSRRVILCGAARQRDLGPQVQRTPVDEHATRTSRVSKRTREGLEGLGVAKSDSLG